MKFSTFLLLVVAAGIWRLALGKLNLNIASSLSAQTANTPADLTTLSGKTYKLAREFRAEPDGITYMISGGMVKIPFADLPEAVRKAHGYDPKAVAGFAAQDEAAQAANYSAAEATSQRQQSDKAAATKRQKLIALIESSKLVGNFQVSQVLDDGIFAYHLGSSQVSMGRVVPWLARSSSLGEIRASWLITR